MKFVHETKTKYEDENTIQKMIQYALFTHIIGPIGPYEACNLCIDSLGNTNICTYNKEHS